MFGPHHFAVRRLRFLTRHHMTQHDVPPKVASDRPASPSTCEKLNPSVSLEIFCCPYLSPARFWEREGFPHSPHRKHRRPAAGTYGHAAPAPHPAVGLATVWSLTWWVSPAKSRWNPLTGRTEGTPHDSIHLLARSKVQTQSCDLEVALNVAFLYEVFGLRCAWKQSGKEAFA